MVFFVFLLDFRIVQTVWYCFVFLLDFRIVQTVWYCFVFLLDFRIVQNSMVFFVFLLDFRIVQTVWYCFVFLLDFRIVQTVWYFLLFILLHKYFSVKKINQKVAVHSLTMWKGGLGGFSYFSLVFSFFIHFQVFYFLARNNQLVSLIIGKVHWNVVSQWKYNYLLCTIVHT